MRAKHWGIVGVCALLAAMLCFSFAQRNGQTFAARLNLNTPKQQQLISDECRQLLALGKVSSKDVWLGTNQLPPHLAALNPQATQILDYDDLIVINVKLQTGFYREGLIVLVEQQRAGVTPESVLRLRLKQLSSNMWYYTEQRK